ncbi:phenylalanine--tRNA ligase subunit beta [Candidatus Omnitrophota bacterium]
MKVTYNWLKDFVDIRIPAETLAEKLTMAGHEVVRLEPRDGDVVLEFEITSNRPDLLSVIGIARETAAIIGRKLKPHTGYSKPVSAKESRTSRVHDSASKFFIKVEDKRDCPLYTARVIQDVKVGPSPAWLKKRLELVGLRSVNNIVDITNYVLMETGQPLHAFDLNRLQGNGIFVRRAKPSETIILIDGQKCELSQEMLVIADSQKPVAIAGIMGGADCEVGKKSSAILLEAAVFDPIITRRASRLLGISSESSYRFERGVDAGFLESAVGLAQGLIVQLAGGQPVIYRKSASGKQATKKTVALKCSEIKRILGRDYTKREIKQTLSGLSFSMRQQSGKTYKVCIPSFRPDINQPVDLIEEIARISGYDQIPSCLPRIIPQGAEVYSSWIKTRQVKNILISQGLNEAVTYSLLSRRLVDEFGYPEAEIMTVANPLSSEQEVLRPGIIPGLINCIAYNLNQRRRDIRLFEVGDIFRNNREEPFLEIAYCAKKDEGEEISWLRGLLELLCQRMGIPKAKYKFRAQAHPAYYFEDISLSLEVDNKLCASAGRIKPSILKPFDIKDVVFAAALNLKVLFSAMDKMKIYEKRPLYPGVTRDISIMLKENISFEDIITKILSLGIKPLSEIKYSDKFDGSQIPTGFKSLTISCIYRAKDRTLTAEEVDAFQQKVIDVLRTAFSAQQR